MVLLCVRIRIRITVLKKEKQKNIEKLNERYKKICHFSTETNLNDPLISKLDKF